MNSIKKKKMKRSKDYLNSTNLRWTLRTLSQTLTTDSFRIKLIYNKIEGHLTTRRMDLIIIWVKIEMTQ